MAVNITKIQLKLITVLLRERYSFHKIDPKPNKYCQIFMKLIYHGFLFPNAFCDAINLSSHCTQQEEHNMPVNISNLSDKEV